MSVLIWVLHMHIELVTYNPLSLAREDFFHEGNFHNAGIYYPRAGPTYFGNNGSTTESLNHALSDLLSCQRRLMSLKRRVEEEVCTTLIHDLFEAHRQHWHREVHRLARRLAGTGIGIKKRRVGLLPSCTPSRAQLIDYVTCDAKLGVLSADVIDFDAEDKEALENVIERSEQVDSFPLAVGLRPADAVHDQLSTAGGNFNSPAEESSGYLATMQGENASSSSGSCGCRGVGSSAFGKAAHSLFQVSTV